VRRQISAGSRVGSRIVIRDGLKAGERVVTAGAIHMKGGI